MKRPSFNFMFVMQVLGGVFTLVGLICVILSMSSIREAEAQFVEAQTLIEDAQKSLALTENETEFAVIKSNITQSQIALDRTNNLFQASQENQSSISEKFLSSLSVLQVGILTLVVGLLSMGAGFLSSIWLNFQVNKAVQESFGRGKKEGIEQGIWQVIDSLDKGESALSAIYLWLYKYRYGKSTTDESARIFQQITNRLKDKFSLQPIGELGKIVKLDHKLHRTDYLDMPNGQQVRVTEVGWKVGDQIIRKPFVDKI